MAGIVKPLSPKVGLVGSGAWFTNNKQIAYRIVYKYTDSNDILHLSEPSERVEVVNTTGSTESAQLTIPIPSVLTTDYYIQVYRTYLSVDQNTLPSDNLYLAIEYQLQSADISNRYVVLTDVTEQNNLGVILYTSQYEEGIQNALSEPPYAKATCFYNNFALYANTKQKHFIQLKMTAPSVMQNDDTITIAGIVYTAKAAESVGSRQFQLFAAGVDYTDAENTMKSLEYIVNRDTSATVEAFYLKDYGGGYGTIIFRAKTYDQAAFTVSCSRAAIFTPDISSAKTSENDERKNRLYYSHEFFPDGVPGLNYFDVGDRNAEIIGIMPMRDSVLIFNSRQEVWGLSGTEQNSFQIDEFDRTIQLYGTKTLQYIDNRLYLFSNQGIVELNNGGKNTRSFPIDDSLLPFLSISGYPNFKNYCCSIGYETDRKYILIYQNQIFVYNFFTNSWSTWEMAANSIYTAFVRTYDDKIYFADNEGYIWAERKEYTNADYCDDNLACTITSSSSFVVTLSSVPAGTAAGDGIIQSGRRARIESISGNDLTLNKILSWQAGAAIIVKPIDCQIEFQPIHANSPQLMKRFIEAVFFFKRLNRSITLSFANNFQNNYTDLEIAATATSNTWGSGSWGRITWGGEITSNLELRRYFPLPKQRALYSLIKLKKEDPFSTFSFVGISLRYSATGNRFRGRGDAV